MHGVHAKATTTEKKKTIINTNILNLFSNYGYGFGRKVSNFSVNATPTQD